MPPATDLAKNDALLKTVNSPWGAAIYPRLPATPSGISEAAGLLRGGGALGGPPGKGSIYNLDTNLLRLLGNDASPMFSGYELVSIPHGSNVVWQSESVSNGQIPEHYFALPAAHLSAEEIVNARADLAPIENTIGALDWPETYPQQRKLLVNSHERRRAVNLSVNPALELVTDPQTLEDAIRISAERERIAQIAEQFELRDREIRVEHLREKASQLARRDAKDLLDSLAVARGLSWSTIATMLGLSPTAIRKWRRGGSVTPENRQQLAALVAFFEMLSAIKEPIADLGSWVEMRVREDTTLTPAELYAAGPYQRWQLLEWARGYIDAATMLGRFDEDWRTTYRRDADYAVAEGPDGERAIVPR